MLGCKAIRANALNLKARPSAWPGAANSGDKAASRLLAFEAVAVAMVGGLPVHRFIWYLRLWVVDLYG